MYVRVSLYQSDSFPVCILVLFTCTYVPQRLVSVQKEACEDGPETPSNRISTLLTYPHLFPACQVGGHQGGTLMPCRLRLRGIHLTQDEAALDDRQLSGSMTASCGRGQEEGVVSCHWGGELAGVNVVAIAAVGGHFIKPED